MPLVNASGNVNVDAPASIGDIVWADRRILNILLLEHVVANHPARFALVGPEAHKIQAVIGGTRPIDASVLNVIPDAEHLSERFVPNFFVVADRVQRSADLNPPVPAINEAMAALRQIGFGVEFYGPGRAPKRHRPASIASTKEER